jgi:hypothetical protein
MEGICWVKGLFRRGSWLENKWVGQEIKETIPVFDIVSF